MDGSGVKALNHLLCHFRLQAPSLLSTADRRKKLGAFVSPSNFSFPSPGFRFSPLCTLPEKINGKVLPYGASQASEPMPRNNLLQVVLVSPQIPGNTGCIARTCAATGVKLHLVEPLGFLIDDTKLKRAGLDYWPYVVVKVHPSWAAFRDYFSLKDGEKRLLAFSKRGTTIHSACQIPNLPLTLSQQLFQFPSFMATSHFIHGNNHSPFSMASPSPLHQIW